MKSVKFYLVAAAMTFCSMSMKAQEIFSSYSIEDDEEEVAVKEVKVKEKLSADSTQLFFDNLGGLNRIMPKPEEVQARIIKINPRIDDIAWSKAVLRVIDLRELQNRPLYYPVEDLAPESQKNLFSIIFAHVLDGSIKAYKSQTNMEQTYVPTFTKENLFNVEEFLEANDLTYYEGIYDKVNYLTPGVTKYYIKEVWYFNKATSTVNNKILAIAPIYDENYNSRSDIRTGVWFWVPFDDLRPYLQQEFALVTGRNTTPLIDFDNFLVSRQFNSYIIKEYDALGYDIDRNIDDPDLIRERQNRVELEILNFDEDLWQY